MTYSQAQKILSAAGMPASRRHLNYLVASGRLAVRHPYYHVALLDPKQVRAYVAAQKTKQERKTRK
jgi:hypothetical protein